VLSVHRLGNKIGVIQSVVHDFAPPTSKNATKRRKGTMQAGALYTHHALSASRERSWD
jgi:hypothetical protein